MLVAFSFYSARSYSFAEYWIHFIARLNGVHAFGYNSITPPEVNRFGWNLGQSEYIAAGPGRFWARSAQKRECPVNNARRYRFPIGFTKFAHRTWICVAMNPFEQDFEKLPAKGLFQKRQIFGENLQPLATSGHDISEMITNHGNSLQLASLQMLTFHFYHWNTQSHSHGQQAAHREWSSSTSLSDACRLVLETWGRIIPRLPDTTGCTTGLTTGWMKTFIHQNGRKTDRQYIQQTKQKKHGHATLLV